MTTLNVARVYLRVSTEDQDLQRQEAIIGKALTSNLGLLRGCRSIAKKPRRSIRPSRAVAHDRGPATG